MKKILAYVFTTLTLTLCGCSGPADPTTVYVRYEVKSEPLGSGQYLTSVDKILYMEKINVLPTEIDQPLVSGTWQVTTSLNQYFLAQLTVMVLQPENPVTDNTKLTLSIYKNNELFQTQTYKGKEITDAASMIVEGTIE